MLKIVGNDVLRGGQKVGWLEGNDVRDHDNRKLGYFTGNDVWNIAGHKLAFIEGNYLDPEGSGLPKIPLDHVTESVTGGTISTIARCAVYLLIGA